MSYDSFGVDFQYDICVLGTESSGKTGLVINYVHDEYIPLYDTSEELYTKIIRKGGTYTEISILDCEHRDDTYSRSRRNQLLNCAGFILAYSITNSESFNELEDTIDRIREVRQIVPPIVVVGLDSDLEQERQVSYKEGESFANEIGAIKFVEASAKWNSEIDEVFEPLVSRLGRKGRRMLAYIVPPSRSPLKSPTLSLQEVDTEDTAAPAIPVESVKQQSVKSVKLPTNTQSETRKAQVEITQEERKAQSSCCVIV